jgi:hypothetical protein
MQFAGLGRLKNQMTSTSYATTTAGFVILTETVKSSMFGDIESYSPAKINILWRKVSLSRSRNRDWLRSGRQRVRCSSPSRGEIFLFSMLSRLLLWPTQLPIQWVRGALSPEVKRPRHEADHLPPTSYKVKNTWVHTSAPPYAFTM